MDPMHTDNAKMKILNPLDQTMAHTGTMMFKPFRFSTWFFLAITIVIEINRQVIWQIVQLFQNIANGFLGFQDFQDAFQQAMNPGTEPLPFQTEEFSASI